MRTTLWIIFSAVSVLLGCAAPDQRSPASPASLVAVPAVRSSTLPQTSELPLTFDFSASQVQSALGATEALKPFETFNITTSRQEDQGEKQLRVTQRGIWVFFDRTGRTRAIRLDVPFAGQIAGVCIGDSRATLVARRGQLPPANLPGRSAGGDAQDSGRELAQPARVSHWRGLHCVSAPRTPGLPA